MMIGIGTPSSQSRIPRPMSDFEAIHELASQTFSGDCRREGRISARHPPTGSKRISDFPGKRRRVENDVEPIPSPMSGTMKSCRC